MIKGQSPLTHSWLQEHWAEKMKGSSQNARDSPKIKEEMLTHSYSAKSLVLRPQAPHFPFTEITSITSYLLCSWR